MLSLAEVNRAARRHNVIPLSTEVPADLLTPVGALMAVRRRGRPCFLLESVTGGENVARYTFLGSEPFLTLRARHGRAWLRAPDGSATLLPGPPLAAVQAHLRRYRPLPVPGLPRFAGGAVGYFAYDCARYLERLPSTAADDDGVDDIALMFYDTVVAFDHAAQRLLAIANVRTDPRTTVRAAYDDARRRLDGLLQALAAAPRGPRLPAAFDGQDRFAARTTPTGFRASVREVKRYIKRGDAFQVVLSQRWSRASTRDPFLYYRMLRRLNPSPYMYYLCFDGAGDPATIAGTSPEMLARVEHRVVQTCPIAGTRPRAADASSDQRRERDLRADPKELAEHVMLVDLGRNDLGRVAVPGSVEVRELMAVERYSHVMHLVSRVQATLRPGLSPLQALMACFPAGTVSGAPKVRAMEIIESLERHRRGIYGGAITYFDFHGNLDSCITIRTLVARRGRVTAQAGAGIVADSDPEREHQETRHKARILFQAVESVERASPARQEGRA